MLEFIADIIDKTMQILISILTLILTPIFSALIVHYQLKKSQFYWKKQQKFINKLELNKLRIETYREVVHLLNELNNVILNHHIYASNRDMTLALSSLLKEISPNDANDFSAQFKTQKNNAENSYLKMREISNRFSGLGVNIKVYFDEDLFNLFLNLHSKIKKAQGAVMTQSEISFMLKDLIEKSNNWIDAKRIFTEKYDNLSEKKRPIVETEMFLTEIMKRFEKKK